VGQNDTIRCVNNIHYPDTRILKYPIYRGEFPETRKFTKKFPKKQRILENFQEFSLKTLTIRLSGGYYILVSR
jgi:hypothetical protein